MTQGTSPVCLQCRHWKGPVSGQWGFFCDAFPDGDGIPAVVIMEGNQHLSPLPGDHGIHFEAKAGGGPSNQ